VDNCLKEYVAAENIQKLWSSLTPTENGVKHVEKEATSRESARKIIASFAASPVIL
jgi:hypothetical protein